ncbi:hypothetical protein TRFO_39523 [Tritrichomonas foetus]|uniref:Uncharacterized protein n=1 Tax=Tritrichomonas foetus TaxID=1144522 RepID=A0A1J4J9B7_9EUKA|nr:hypothetical protein TRFO_39523 [Tritrichomonas foetus]|eukprot:OHS94275.1 hypothetical protein TRFO_39523 [Tritrichomonas foetus]
MNLNENSVNSTNSASKKLASKFIKKSPVIIFRNRFSRLVAYLISSMPLQKSLHSIVSVIRLLQILFVSLFFGNKKLWVPGTLEYKTGDILSIVFRPWPQNTSFYSYTIFGWISLALTIYIVPMEIVMSIIFRQKGTLSQKLVHFWSFITSSVEFIIYPMMGCNLGHLIGNFVNDSDVTPTPYLIALTTMLIIVLVVNLYINNLINAACVTFVSTSIPTIDISCQPKSVIVMTIICFIQELSCNLDNAHIVRIILMVINICLQTVHYAIFDILGMIIDDFDLLLFKTVSCVGWSNSILALILYCLNSRMGIWFIIVDFCLGLLYFVVFYIEQKRRDAKVLATIDSIHDDPGNIVNFKRYLDFAKSSFIGFKNNHPYCINFQIFIDYCREFPEEQRALMLFAKFISMYPEESSQLQHIYISLKRNKQHTMRYKSVMKQIQMILLKRDATLRPELKREIEAANQLVTTCKLRLRMIWEAVLEGSTRDLGSYFRRFDEPYMEIQRAFANFRNYHPNSPYATSLCASIAQDIMRDPQLAEEMQNEADHLSKGKFLNSDSVQIAAFIQFPSVPHLSQGRFTHQADYVSIYSSDKDEMNVFNEEDHEFAENLEILKYIKEIISQVRSPSAGFIRVFVMFYTIISLLCLWASIYVIPSLLSKIIIPANVFTSSLYLNMEIKISYGLTFRIFLENIGIIKNECNEAMFNYTTNKENIGGTCSSTEQIEYFASHIIDISEDYERMFDFIEIPALKQVRDMFFESSHLNYEYTSNTTRQLSPASPHQQLMDFSKRCIHLANLEANKFWDFVGMGLFGSLVANAQNLSDTILEMCTVIENYII